MILLLTVDTLRADHLGCYGYRRETSPYIDRLAGDGLLFERCFSHAPVTGSSFASIQSGFLPHETGVFDNMPLPEGVDMLSEILSGRGYTTAAVVSNYALRKESGWTRGFEVYDDTMEDYERVRHLPERVAGRTTNRALELLNSLSAERLFLWVHYQDPHGPYTPPERFQALFHDPQAGGRHITLKVNRSVTGYGGIPSYQRLDAHRDYGYYVAQYDGEIRYADEQIGRLIAGLKERGLYDDTFIIFTSDHGEGMGEHDYYFAHGENLYRPLIHVPLILRHGRHLSGRRRDLVQHLDIVPTIRNLVGLDPDPRLRGRDLRDPPGEQPAIFAEMRSSLSRGVTRFSLIADRFKLIHTQPGDRYELFDTLRDPMEVHNLIDEPDLGQTAHELQRLLNRIRAENRLGRTIVPKPRTLTEEEKRKLRSLGYVY